ncbi:MAG: tetratricopeptide repeat protein [Planctomycetales bacterium]
MKRWQTLLRLIIGLELVGAAVAVGWRLSSTSVLPPPVADSEDATTGRELLALPHAYLIDSGDKWRTLGETYLVFGYFAKADACLAKGAAAQPESAEIALTRGMCLERLGKLDEAANWFRNAADLGTREVAPLAWYHLGRNFLRQERPDEAAAAFEAAGDLYPGSVYQRAKLLVRSGHAAEAEPLLEQLSEQYDNDLRILQLRARAADQTGREDLAVELRAALNLASARLQVDDTDDFQKPIRERFGLPREIARAERLREAGNARGGAQRLARLVDDDPLWEQTYLYLLQDAAFALLRVENSTSDEIAQARRLLERQIQEQGFPTALAWELLGDVERRSGHVEQARDAWSHAERMLPGASVLLKLAEVEQDQGEVETARRHRAQAAQYAGMELLRQGQLDQAVARFREGVAQDANLPDLWYYAGEGERFLGNTTQAEAAYRRALKLNPDHGRALARAAWMESRRSQPRPSQ